MRTIPSPTSCSARAIPAARDRRTAARWWRPPSGCSTKTGRRGARTHAPPGQRGAGLALALHVLLGLRVRRNSAMSIHRPFPRVVGRDREGDVARIAIQEIAQVAHATLDVLAWVEGIAHAQHHG